MLFCNTTIIHQSILCFLGIWVHEWEFAFSAQIWIDWDITSLMSVLGRVSLYKEEPDDKSRRRVTLFSFFLLTTTWTVSTVCSPYISPPSCRGFKIVPLMEKGLPKDSKKKVSWNCTPRRAHTSWWCDNLIEHSLNFRLFYSFSSAFFCANLCKLQICFCFLSDVLLLRHFFYLFLWDEIARTTS